LKLVKELLEGGVAIVQLFSVLVEFIWGKLYRRFVRNIISGPWKCSIILILYDWNLYIKKWFYFFCSSWGFELVYCWPADVDPFSPIVRIRTIFTHISWPLPFVTTFFLQLIGFWCKLYVLKIEYSLGQDSQQKPIDWLIIYYGWSYHDFQSVDYNSWWWHTLSTYIYIYWVSKLFYLWRITYYHNLSFIIHNENKNRGIIG
jgi:hypothetical protein